jgi:pentatricopeptide repeat protein
MRPHTLGYFLHAVSGLVSEGQYYFKEMKIIFGIEPRSEHYACMIDLMGKVGLLDEAFEIARSMPMVADEAGWGSLLNTCMIGECVANPI